MIEDETLQAICDVLGETQEGLTGWEIELGLKRLSLPDPEPGTTKRYRLFDALSLAQQQARSEEPVLDFHSVSHAASSLRI